MLTTGVEILGLFVYAQSSDQKVQSFKKLNSIMNSLFTPDFEEETKDEPLSNKSKQEFHN